MKCEVHGCGYVAPIRLLMYHNMEKHRDILKFSCDLCSFRADRTNHLRCHMLMHRKSPKQKYQYTVCSVCSCEFNTVADAAKHHGSIHQSSKKKEKKFHCRMCNYMLVVQKELFTRIYRN